MATNQPSDNLPLADVLRAANELVAAKLIEDWALGGALAAIWKVTEMVPGRRFTWRSGLPAMRVFATHAIALTATGSKVTLLLHYRGLLGKVLARMTRGVARRYLEFEANGLKERSERSSG